ncbi:peroxiredoxin family protein [Ureibacillus aquaedulcis]|uniref:TlpA disulfide reductase family protein n=1 Tax=Ureibacillus aquaedulcis TaxID=3058421 RepID=A0ABT8GLH5_9BACL|nr:TlpA disulfide reductase family protein [Ureibacillus sp. BA0131]MDN4492264.1 TlpA disulfide reductase family protein [Ureibacillus sp. BA0131]
MKKKAIGLSVVMILVVIMLGTYIKNQIEASEAISEQAVSYEMDLNQEEGLEKGQVAPNFTLQTLTGETFTLSELKGKKVILNFWASWCPPCKKEMPHLQKYYEENAQDDNAVIVGVNITHAERSVDQIKTVQQFVDSFDLTFPIPLMEEEGVDKLYQIITIPSTFMIDTEGRIQRQIVGPLDQEALRDYVKNLD